jgi:TonB family protein
MRFSEDLHAGKKQAFSIAPYALSALFHFAIALSLVYLGEKKSVLMPPETIIKAHFVEAMPEHREPQSPKKPNTSFTEPVASKPEPAVQIAKPMLPPKPADAKVAVSVKPEEISVLKTNKKSEPKEQRQQISARDRLSKLSKGWSNDLQSEASSANSAANGQLARTYAEIVAARIRQSYELPSILTLDERRNLSVHVALKISTDGKLLAATVLRPSKNKLFDRAVISAAEAIEGFGPPPAELKGHFALEGLQIEFCPLKCN